MYFILFPSLPKLERFDTLQFDISLIKNNDLIIDDVRNIYIRICILKVYVIKCKFYIKLEILYYIE